MLENDLGAKVIAVIDYGAGNLMSVVNILKFLGEDYIITNNAQQLLSSDGVILPGVGQFGDAMASLESKGLVETIREIHRTNLPLLGICLGQQMLFEKSDESPNIKGIGLFLGEIKKLNTSKKIPHIGWSDLYQPKSSRILKGVGSSDFFYFVHSYCVKAQDREIVVARTNYTNDFDSCVESGNTFGVQFHPEKSSDAGKKIIRNFLEIAKINAKERKNK